MLHNRLLCLAGLLASLAHLRLQLCHAFFKGFPLNCQGFLLFQQGFQFGSVDLIFEQPYCRIGNLVEAGIAGRQAASRHLKALAAIGVLREQAVGREKLFVNVRLLQLLTGATNTFAPFPRRGAGGEP